MALRVIHLPDAVGGQAAGLARAERDAGLESIAVTLDPSPYGYPMDEVIRRAGMSRVRFEAARLRLIRRALRDFDVIHFNFGSTILPGPARGDVSWRYRMYARVAGMRDLQWFARAGKVIAVSFQGDDVRQGDVLRARYERSLATENAAAYTASGDAAKRRIAATFDRYAHRIFFLNPDLGWVLPHRASFLPYASVDLDAWRPSRMAAGQIPRLLHAPSDRAVKGTAIVEAAVEQLRREGVPFDFQLVEGLSREEARWLYQGADVFIDQLHAGWYGAAAVELMALGKPVLSFLRHEDFVHAPQELVRELPVIDVSPASIVDRLRELLTSSPETRFEIGARGRAFVERWHNPRLIGRYLRREYEDAAASLH